MCSTIVEQSVQRASTSLNIFENKGKVESILNESLNRFELDSTFFTLDDLFKRTEHLVQQSVECMLN